MAFPIPLLGTIANGVIGWFSKKQEIKSAKQTAEAKLAQAKTDGNFHLQLSDREWEALAVKGTQDSWKDEYVTILITSPIALILLGAVLTAFGVDAGPKLLTGAKDGIKELTTLGMDYGFVLSAVVLAAIGLKVGKKFL